MRLFKYSEHVSKPKKSEIEPKKIFKYGLDESTIIFFDLCYLSERLNNIRRKSSCAILSLSQIYNRKLYTYWLRDLFKINVKNHMVNWKYENVIHKFYGRCIRCIRRHVQVKMTVYCISHVCPQSSLTGVIFCLMLKFKLQFNFFVLIKMSTFTRRKFFFFDIVTSKIEQKKSLLKKKILSCKYRVW